MQRVITVSSLLVVLVLVLTFPARTQAAGVPVKGQQIHRAGQLGGNTGRCECEWMWYTVGLKRGTVRASAVITGCRLAPLHSCTLWIDLMRGYQTLVHGARTCSTPKRGCRSPATVSFNIKKPGAYYILIRGIAAEGIAYRMSLKGPVYRLHCSASC